MVKVYSVIKQGATVCDIPISNIVVTEGRRDLGDINELAASIAEIGLLQPIILVAQKKGYRLVAGRHRLAACLSLGWATIPCIIKDYSALDAELAEIDENIQRNDLTVLERCEQLAKRKKIYEAKYPEARKGNTKARQQVKRNNFALRPSFATSAAAKTNLSARTIQQEVKLVNDLPESVRDLIRGLGVANNRAELTKLAGYDRDKQKEIAACIQRGEAESVAKAARLVDGAETPRQLSDPLLEFNETLSSLWTLIDRSNQYGEFQKLFDGVAEETRQSYLTRLTQIHVELGHWIRYLQKTQTKSKRTSET